MRKMKRLSKRGLALFLALTMCLSLMQITAFATETGDQPIELTVGDTYEFGKEQAVFGKDGNWSVSDPEVLSIDDDGAATALKAGEAEVTFTVEKEILTGPAPVVPEQPPVEEEEPPVEEVQPPVEEVQPPVEEEEPDEPSDTGDNGDDANTGDNGDDANTSDNGDDANTGDNGDDANTGDNDDDANTGDNGDDANTGDNGDDANTGDNGDDANTGDNGDDANTGDNGDDANTGDNGDDANTGDSGDDANTGDNGSDAGSSNDSSSDADSSNDSSSDAGSSNDSSSDAGNSNDSSSDAGSSNDSSSDAGSSNDSSSDAGSSNDSSSDTGSSNDSSSDAGSSNDSSSDAGSSNDSSSDTGSSNDSSSDTGDTSSDGPSGSSDTDGAYVVYEGEDATVYTWTVIVSEAGHEHVWAGGVCTECGAECAHEYADGVCAVCGMAEPVEEPAEEFICGVEDPDHVHAPACYAVIADLVEKAGALPEAETLPEEMPQDEYDALQADLEALLALYGDVQDVPGWDEYEPAMAAYMKVLALWEKLEGVTAVPLDEGKIIVTYTNNTTKEFPSGTSLGYLWTCDLEVQGHWKGVIVKKGTGTVNITGDGTIDADGYDTSAITIEGSGKVILKDGVTITGGTGTKGVDGNVTKDDETSGGGVLVKGGTFVMEGGTIDGNSASRGGGIYVCMGANLEITGGTISNNRATGVTRNGSAGNFGGGGIWINGTADIRGNVKITGNTSAAKMDLGGGGIYVNSNYGKLTLINAVITNNTAGGLGGGVATCVHGKIAEANMDHAAIYGNHIDPTNPATISGAVDASEAWSSQPLFKQSAVDILSAGNEGRSDANGHSGGTIISDKKLGDEVHGWTGYAIDTKGDDTLRPVTPASNGVIYGGYALGLTATNTKDPVGLSSMVEISGNTSATHGGGVACNGILLLGANPNVEIDVHVVDGDLDLDITKTIVDVEGGTGASSQSKAGYTFELLDKDRNFIAKATSDESGKATLSYAKGIDTNGGNKAPASNYTFYVQETGTKESIINDTAVWKVDVVVEPDGEPEVKRVYTDHGTHSSYETVTFYHYKTTETVTKGKLVGSEWQEWDEKTESIPGNKLSFTNTYDPRVGLSVTKTVTWNPEESEAPKAGAVFTFEVTLGGETAEHRDASVYQGPGVYTLTTTLTEDAIQKAKSNSDGTMTATCEVMKITNIPRGTPYSIVEDGVQLAEGAAEGANVGYELIEKVDDTLNEDVALTLDNRYFDSQTTEISGYKDWGDVPQDLWPEFITVQLWRTTEDGEAELVTFAGGQTDNEGNAYVYAPSVGSQWGYSFGELPKFASEGVPYTYKVKETGICYGDAAEKLAAYLNRTPGAKTFSHIEQDGDMFVIYGTGTVTDIETDSTQWQVLGAWLPTYKTDDDGALVIQNRWLDSDDVGEVDFKVKKVNDGGNILSGAEFTLYDEEDYNALNDGSLPDGVKRALGRPVTTGADGIAEFTNLIGGTYYLVETKAPTGYQLNSTVWKLTVSKTDLEYVEARDSESTTLAGWINHWTWDVMNEIGVGPLEKDTEGAAVLTVTDARIQGYISIAKDVSLTTGSNVQDIDRDFTFEIRDAAGTLVQTLEIPANGSAASGLLDYGTYTITEAGDKEVPGFQWNGVTFNGGSSESITVDVRGEQGQTYTVTATNSYTELGEMSIRKELSGSNVQRDREWNFILTLHGNTSHNEPTFTPDGGEATVSGEDGVYTITMKAGTTVTVSGISVGTTYEVIEVEAGRNGYTTSATKDGENVPYVDGALEVEGTIAHDEADEVVFTNYRGGGGGGDNPPRTPEEPEEPEEPNEPERPEEPDEPEVPDEPVPMDDFEVPEEDVPLAEKPEEQEEVEVPDEDVPLDGAPQTGDTSKTGLWGAMALFSGVAALWLARTKKRDDEV